MAVDSTKPVIAGVLNHVTAATVTPGTEAAGFDGDNVKTPTYASTWRSTGTGATNLDFDLGGVKSDIEAIVLHGVNLTDTASVRITVDNDAGLGSPQHDSGTIGFDVTRAPAAGLDDTPPWGRTLVYLPASTWSGRYVRVALTDAGNADGYMEVAYAVIGPVVQPGKAVAWGTSAEWIGEPGVSVARRGHSLGFRMVDEATRRKVLSLGRALQGLGRVTVIPRPADAASWLAEAILARLTRPPEELHLVGLSRWDVTLQFEEVTD